MVGSGCMAQLPTVSCLRGGAGLHGAAAYGQVLACWGRAAWYSCLRPDTRLTGPGCMAQLPMVRCSLIGAGLCCAAAYGQMFACWGRAVWHSCLRPGSRLGPDAWLVSEGCAQGLMRRPASGCESRPFNLLMLKMLREVPVFMPSAYLHAVP